VQSLIFFGKKSVIGVGLRDANSVHKKQITYNKQSPVPIYKIATTVMVNTIDTMTLIGQFLKKFLSLTFIIYPQSTL
jgi:hypothetical protein